MLDRLARRIIRRRRAVIAISILVLGVAGFFGIDVGPHLSEGGFDGPSEPATAAATALLAQFHSGAPNVTVLVSARHGTVDDPGAAAAGQLITRRLESEADVANVESYWQLGDIPALRTDHGRSAVIALRIEGTQDQFVHRERAVAASLATVPAAITVRLGGYAPAFSEVDALIERGLIIAELIAVPLTLLLLLFVFGSVVAAAMPLTIAGVAVIGTLAILRLLSMVTEVSVFAENLTTALSFGLAIDYSLFIVSRYREELDAGFDHDLALTRAVSRAGRMVFGSALTVVAALSVLLVFPIAFLRSIALAGSAVAFLAGVAAIIVLPAALSILGPRINALTVWQRSIRPPENGYWRRSALVVMRHPVAFGGAAIALLMFLASPFLGIHLGYLDDKVLPLSDPVRQTDDTLRQDFDSGQVGAIQVVMPSYGNGDGTATPAPTLAVEAKLYDYARRLSELPQVLRVESALGFFVKGQHIAVPAAYAAQYYEQRGTWFSVLPVPDPLSVQAEAVVHEVRDAPAPYRILVGGLSAQYLDSTSIIEARMPLAFALIAVIMFALLFVLFGSVVIPLKAMVLNVLSLSATFGAMVWIFQDGHLSGLLDFTATGSVIAAIPVMMFCVAFGLSMDYEVFLISRIKERHDHGASIEEAVAGGLQRSGRIITAAAMLLAVVFLTLTANEISGIKLFGVGLFLAVLTDAFIIRGVLVPAFMKLMGEANWWAPAPLKHWHLRRDLSPDRNDHPDRYPQVAYSEATT